ncbi:MAG: hypothetical protein HBSAPP01_01830 [Candidatus Brocadia sapporoensis]|nr:MAG: hypothetical protein HBSAPP01_01830 [Candidatus Brocadia sapporoensis]
MVGREILVPAAQEDLGDLVEEEGAHLVVVERQEGGKSKALYVCIFMELTRTKINKNIIEHCDKRFVVER